MSTTWLLIAIFAGALSLGVAGYLFLWVKRQDAGTERAREVARWIR